MTTRMPAVFVNHGVTMLIFLPAVGCPLSAISCFLVLIFRLLSVVWECCLAISCPMSAVYCLFSAAWCLLSSVRKMLSAVYSLPLAFSLRLFILPHCTIILTLHHRIQPVSLTAHTYPVRKAHALHPSTTEKWRPLLDNIMTFNH
jgi:hypothetical protein